MAAIPAWKIYPTLIAATLLTACSSEPIPPPLLQFEIKADYQSNLGNLFYFVIRNTNEKQFMLESYQDIASKAFADPPDPGALGVFSIVPGTEQTYTVNQPLQGSIGLYFLFTQPGLQWKELLAMPLAEKYSIELKENNKVNIKENKSWFSWF